MSRITEELIRKKAEHHDGILADLEEISLHQLELERIEVIGTLCRKLRILYLQNNIIPKIEGLNHMKQLQYLNLALNNVTKIEGLSSCEFLNKLDLTVNFIDLDALEESVTNMTSLLHLRELYLMGNPCMEEDAWPEDPEWKEDTSASSAGGAAAGSGSGSGATVGMGAKARSYIVARLPQLQILDGKEITRAERIKANQRLPKLRAQLRVVADQVRERKGLEAQLRKAAKGDDETDDEDDDGRPGADEQQADDDASEPWCPETRVKMYREQAKRKQAEEARKKAMEPPKRDYEKEHAEAVSRALAREAMGGDHVRQCNEGRWEFILEDEDGSGNVVVRLQLSKYLDSSLIHAEVHPTYVTVIVKGKTFRLSLPHEVRADAGRCQRSRTTGELLITAPKLQQNAVLSAIRRREKQEKEAAGGGGKKAPAAAAEDLVNMNSSNGRVKRLGNGGSGRSKLMEEMMEEAGVAPSTSSSATTAAPVADGRGRMAGAVKVEAIVKEPKNKDGPGAVAAAPSRGKDAKAGEVLPDGHGGTMLFRAAETKRTAVPSSNGEHGGPPTGQPPPIRSIPQGMLGAKGATALAKDMFGGAIGPAVSASDVGGDEDDLPPLI